MQQTKWMRLSLAALLLVALFITPFALAGEAEEAEAFPAHIECFADPDILFGDTAVTVSISVQHGGGEAPVTVSLLDPAGEPCASFGNAGTVEIAPGGTEWHVGYWNVTDAERAAGQIVFTAVSGDATVPVPVSIRDGVREGNLSVERKITPPVATEGESVTISYLLKNVGLVDIGTITITDPGITVGELSYSGLLPDEVAEISYGYVADDAPRTSGASIDYRLVAGERSFLKTEQLEPVTIEALPGIAVQLISSAPGTTGDEPLTLRCTVTNNGSWTLTNVRVVDPTLGDIGRAKALAPGETLEFETSAILFGDSIYQFVVIGDRETGEPVEVLSNQILVYREEAAEAKPAEAADAEDQGKPDRFGRRWERPEEGCHREDRRERREHRRERETHRRERDRDRTRPYGHHRRNERPEPQSRRQDMPVVSSCPCAEVEISLALPDVVFKPTWPFLCFPKSGLAILTE